MVSWFPASRIRTLDKIITGLRRIGSSCIPQIESKMALQESSSTTGILNSDNGTADVLKLAANLRKCDNESSLLEGKRIHDHIVKVGLGDNRFLGNLLVQMYGKCGALQDARQVFNSIENKNSFTWNIMIAAYLQHEKLREAIKIFKQMPEPNTVSYNIMIAAYGQQGWLKEAVEYFNHMPQKNVISWNVMISAYSQHGQLNEAVRLFYQMPEKNVVSWNGMITLLARHGKFKEALDLFRQMPERNTVSWNVMISAYSQRGKLDEALKLFREMPQPNIISWNAMLGAYTKQGSLKEAEKMFREMPERDVISWNNMIAAYAEKGMLKEAVEYFEQMPHQDVISWNTIIGAYVQQGKMEEANQIFQRMPQRDVISWTAMISGYTQHGHLTEALELFQQIPYRDAVSWNAMIAGYAQQGQVKEALELFEQMPQRNVVSWNAMILGYSLQGQLDKALELYHNMKLEDICPDKVTYVSILDACVDQAALAEGRLIHNYAIEDGYELDVLVGTSLINMYGKCGDIEDAHAVFDKMPERSLVSWNSLLIAYAQHGHGSEALQLFQQMNVEGVSPDQVTFICLLSACRHAGLICEGYYHLISMCKDHSVPPTVEHHNCMNDLLGRIGQLDITEALINNMPLQPNPTSWKALLGSCSYHLDVKRGKRVAENVFELDPAHAAGYVSLCNLYAANELHDPAKMREWLYRVSEIVC